MVMLNNVEKYKKVGIIFIIYGLMHNINKDIINIENNEK